MPTQSSPQKPDPAMNKKRIKKNLPAPTDRKQWILAGLVLLLTFLLFSPALKGGFTNWDDDRYITDNPVIKHLSVGDLGKYSDTFVGNFQPLTILSYAVDYSLVGMNPFWYHLENILLHLLNTLLVFFLVRSISKNNLFVSLFTMLLFGIHPMHIESVAWVAERKDVLYTFFFLSGLLLYYRYLGQQKLVYLGAAGVAFVLSCLAKSAAVVFPVVLLLIDYYENRKISRQSLLEKVPFFLVSLWIGWIALQTQASSNALGSFQLYSLFEKIRFASYGFMNYLVKFLVPFNLSSFHPYPPKDNLPVTFNLAVIAVLVVLGYFAVKGRKVKWLVFGAAFYFVSVALVLQFITVGNAVIAERYTYVSYIGIGFIYATLAHKVLFESRNQNLKYLAGSLLAVQLLFFAVTTYSHTAVWKDSVSLWNNVIEKYPNESGAYSNRGHNYRMQNNLNMALADYNKAIELDNKNHLAISNRGKVWFEKGMLEKSLADYNRAIELHTTSPDYYSNRGAVYARLNDYSHSIADLNRAIEMDSKNSGYYSNRGATYAINKDYPHAIADYNKSLEIEPSNLDALLNLGLAYFNMGQFRKTIEVFQRSLKIRPDNADILNDVGLAYYQLKELDQALQTYNRAIRLNGSKGLYYLNRSYVYKDKGDKPNALKDALMAQKLGSRLNPEYLEGLR